MSKLIKISKLYKDLGVTRQTIYNWIKQGRLKVIKTPGGHNFVSQEIYNSLLNIEENKNNRSNNEEEK